MTAGGFPHSEILGSKPGWRLPEAYRSLQRPSSVLSAKASTPRPCRQPIHPYGTRKTPYRQIPRRQIITSEMITKRSTNNNKQNIQMKFDRKTIEAKRRPTASASLASTIQFSNHHAPKKRSGHGTPAGRPPQGDIRKTARDQVAGGGPGTQKHTHTTARRPPTEPAKPTISSTPARPHHSGNRSRHVGHTTDARPAS